MPILASLSIWWHARISNDLGNCLFAWLFVQIIYKTERNNPWNVDKNVSIRNTYVCDFHKCNFRICYLDSPVLNLLWIFGNCSEQILFLRDNSVYTNTPFMFFLVGSLKVSLFQACHKSYTCIGYIFCMVYIQAQKAGNKVWINKLKRAHHRATFSSQLGRVQ
jgi:hypothetical protein